MAEMDYRFGDMEQVNLDVQTELGKFGATLEDYEAAYRTLAQAWGGEAAMTADAEAKKVNGIGVDTAGIVDRFLKALVGHRDLAMETERANTGRFDPQSARS